MKGAALLLLLGLACAAAYTEDEYQTTFSSWMKAHSKVYSAEDFQTRYTIFKSNMDFVRDWNARNTQTVLGLNAFADLSNAEYRRIYLGTKVHVSAPLASASKVEVADTYNATVDWRSKGVLTPIKDQGQCGSCWAFSTTGSTEAAHMMVTGNLVSLSEQNLMDCSTEFGNEGCDGGLMDNAFEYIISNKGIDTEASYPYQGVQGACAFKAANIGATISNYTDVASGSETALATAVTKTPVSVAIDASHESFQLYSSGIYYESACSAENLDHGVLTVGYGVDSNGTQYWIVKNSWGVSWGMNGFIYMSKSKNNNCGIATSASWPTI